MRRLLSPLAFVAAAFIAFVAAGPAPLIARDRAAALAGAGERLLQAGQTDQSLPYLRKLLELQPHNDNARYALALALLFPTESADRAGGLTRNRLQESADHLTECLERARGVSDTGAFTGGRLFYLALAHWWLGNPDQALGFFEQSFRADPERIEALYNRFAIYEELGKSSEARLELDRYLKLAESAQ
ncbi:MAG: hypothetical protein RIF32_22175 [Leptospirales bacterium]